MKEKSTLHIYFNNAIAFLNFSILRVFLKKKKYKSSNILFINTGQIGDLVISSLVFENLALFKNKQIYFLINSKYEELFCDYTGQTKLMKLNLQYYKYNPIYKIKFLNKLRNLCFEKTINVTTARGITNDELALLSGGKEIICINSNWRYLKKLFGNQMDKKYDQIINVRYANEYQKTIELIIRLSGSEPSLNTKIYLSKKTMLRTKEMLSKILEELKYSNLVTVSPLSDLDIKNWGIRNYLKLINRLLDNTDYIIILLGSKNQSNKMKILNMGNNPRILNFAGKLTLLESASVVSLSNIFIGNDSGFTHIAKALNQKTVGIIGGGSFNIFFPYHSDNREIMLYHKMDCFGCEWRCIKDKPYCHANITVDEVFNAVIKLLKSE